MTTKFQNMADINAVIDSAVKTLEISKEQYERILNNCEIPQNFNAFRIPGYKLARLWKALCIPYLQMYFGYKKDEHLTEICSMSSLSQCRFRNSPNVISAYKRRKKSKIKLPVLNIPQATETFSPDSFI